MKKALFLGYVWPELKTTAAGHRMMQLIQAFQEQQYQITFASTAQPTPYSHDLQALDIVTEPIALNDESFDTFIKTLAPDVVIFDRFMVEEQFGWRVAEYLPQAIRILNTEDLHSLRDAREKCLKETKKFSQTHWLHTEKTKREVASIYRSDLSLLVSTYEMDLLINHVNMHKSLLMHMPLFYEAVSEQTFKNWPSFDERQDFIMVGNGKHAPNVDAIKHLNKYIWPLIRKQLPSARIQCYGAYLPQQVKELHKPKAGFIVKGWVEDLPGVMQHARVQLAPLRFGAGIKGKLLESMRNGLPFITTSIGVEGMCDEQDWSASLADEPEEFANKAVSLYQNQRSWTKIQLEGIAVLNRCFAKERHSQRLFSVLADIQSNPTAHRSQNFIGAMIQQQTMASTKYMAKWIEAKNRKK
ncbi:MAG: glycosyltransferase family 4 protein [Croceitalea sp.]|nr:glycosyltransferase family 4 protein [Croceitalea sp.]